LRAEPAPSIYPQEETRLPPPDPQLEPPRDPLPEEPQLKFEILRSVSVDPHLGQVTSAVSEKRRNSSNFLAHFLQVYS
jgi:hypothetical protein